MSKAQRPTSYRDAWRLSSYPNENLMSLVFVHPSVGQLWVSMVLGRGIDPTLLGPVTIKYGSNPGDLVMVADMSGGPQLCLTIPPRCWLWIHSCN